MSISPSPTYAKKSKTDTWIGLYQFSFVICIIIMFLQIFGLLYNSSRLKATNRESYATRKGSALKILISLFIVYISCTLGLYISFNRLNNVTTKLCKETYQHTFIFYGTTKIFNYYFFLIRAKLAQGLKPLINKKWFNIYFPIILVGLYILYIVFIYVFPLNGYKVRSPNTGRYLCIWDNVKFIHQFEMVLITLIDLFMTFFLLYLYGKPLHTLRKRRNIEIQKSNENKTNKTRKEEFIDVAEKNVQGKLDRCIVINFVCSSVVSFHTILCALTWFWINFFEWWSIIDFLVNCICLFMMFASNRRLLLHMLCCFNICMNNSKLCCKNKDAIKHTINARKQTLRAMKIIELEVDRSNTFNNNSPNNSGGKRPSGKISTHAGRTISDFQMQTSLSTNFSSNASITLQDIDSGDSTLNEIDNSNNNSSNNIELKEYLSNNCGNNIAIDGINYEIYLFGKDINEPIIYYKSKLFYTWFCYTFCCFRCYFIFDLMEYIQFKWNKSKYKEFKLCKYHIKNKNNVLNHLFSATDNIQRLKYYYATMDRLAYKRAKQKYNEINNNNSPSKDNNNNDTNINNNRLKRIPTVLLKKQKSNIGLDKISDIRLVNNKPDNITNDLGIGNTRD